MTPSDPKIPDYLPLDLPRFRLGDAVAHRHYGYRGVVVDFDLRCLADESWYESNRTQPDRDQPWYHVLVDGGELVTYAAEANLRDDDAGEPIVHPLMTHFFEPADGPPYERNDEPWPGW